MSAAWDDDRDVWEAKLTAAREALEDIDASTSVEDALKAFGYEVYSQLCMVLVDLAALRDNPDRVRDLGGDDE